MNRELYIHTLRMLREQYEIARMDTVVETIDAALAEFERPTDSDCISRQAALNMELSDVISEGGAMYASWRNVRENLEKLPSAQPDLESAYAEGWTAAESKYRAMMSDGDCISRQEAIDALKERLQANGYSNVALVSELNRIIGYLMQMPSAEPEIIRCKDCKNSEHWYRDRRRCFLWSENGISVFDDGFCNYAERRTDG